MHLILFPLIVVFCAFGMDFWARLVFLAAVYRGRYKHGKTGNRATKHYKKNWTFLQRLFWLPAFKEYYEFEYRALAIFSYVQYIFGVFIIVFFWVSMALFPSSKIWVDTFGMYMLLIFVRIFHNNGVARGKI